MDANDLQTATTHFYMAKGNRLTGRSRRRKRQMDISAFDYVLHMGPRTMHRFIIGMLVDIVNTQRYNPRYTVYLPHVDKLLQTHLQYVNMIFMNGVDTVPASQITSHQKDRLRRTTLKLHRMLRDRTHDGTYRRLIIRNLRLRGISVNETRPE